MAQQLAYVIITPYTLHKSRTGGILARLITRTGLELAAARMFAPSAELVQRYSDVIISTADPQDRRIQELIRDYIMRNLAPDPKTKRSRRAMVLLFRGEEAVRKVRSVIGNISPERHGGETIRDTYGDLILDEHDQVRYFEPAVLAAPTPDEAVTKLKLWASYSERDGGIVDNTLIYGPEETPQRTLVLIKPDNFRFATGRPGNVIDFLSRTGLYIVGIKVHRMSVAEASEFYGPVREVLRTKLKDVVAARAKAVLEKEFGFKIPAAEEKHFGEMLGPAFGDSQFDNIVKFMSGRSPADCDPALARQPGTEKCIALIYEGVSAIGKIRDVLGPTDPSKAPPGSVRREFGSNIMVNAAHASDSVESAQREMKIVNVGENNFRAVVEEVYGKGLGMGKILSWRNPALHRFNVTEYYRMAEIGVLQEDASVELLDGKVFDRSDGTLHRFSVTDYYRMAEAGVLRPGARVELLDGQIIDMSPIGPVHGGAVKRLNRLFNRRSRDRWLIAVQDPVHLEDHSEPQPDLMLLKPVADDYTSRHPKPEDVLLLVEVSDSTLDTDREIKVPVYGRAGIAEVWIVNMDERALEVYREPHFAGYANTQILRSGDKVAPALFPDAVIEVADLLRR